MKPTRRTLTVMFTDMKGYSTLMGEDEAAALQILEQHNAVIDPCIPAHDGRLVKGTGDGYMICFQSALDALRCAFSIQDSVSNLRHGNEPIRIRIGINSGDVFVGKDDDLYGEVVNNAKRIEAEASSAGICVSESVRQNISTSERKQFSFQGGSELSLKGSAELVKCWHVTKADGSRIPPVSVKTFVPQPATRNPAIFFHDVSDLIGDRSGSFKISDGAKLYLRLYPKFSVARIDSELEAKNLISGARLKPLGRATSWGADRNAFGAIIFEAAADGTIQYYTQRFLSRELWGVDSVILNEDWIRKQLEQSGQPHISPKHIAVGYVEQYLVECLDGYLAFAQAHLQLSVPLVVEGGLVGIKGYSITLSNWQMSGKALRDVVSWSVQIESFEKPPWEILESLFNKIWNNCGLERPRQTQAELAKFCETRR